MLRKLVAQVGVLLFIGSMLEGIFSPFIIFVSGWFPLLLVLFFECGIFVLVIASLLPAREGDAWGCMWPLVGYDNAIDAVYTRGPWWVRFAELEEQARERGVIEGMHRLFDTG
jgi:hypothetical protein